MDDEVSSVDTVRYFFVNLNGAFQRLIQKHYIYDVNRDNDLMNVGDGYLLLSSDRTVNEKKLKKSADTMIQTSEELESEGRDVLYISAVGRAYMCGSTLMDGIPNTRQDEITEYLSLLEENGVSVIDSSKVEGCNELSDYYKTDHHWRTQSAFKIFQAIGDFLMDQDYEVDPAVFEEDSYEATVHKNAFLGSEGHRVGIYYSGLDDFVTLLPAFETQFTLENHETGEIKSGSFEDCMVDSEKNCDQYSFTENMYYYYWGGDHLYATVTNENTENDQSVLVVKDSYGIPISAFLTCAFKETTVVDRRYYKDQTLREIIEDVDPDLVVFVYGSGYLEKSSMVSLD